MRQHYTDSDELLLREKEFDLKKWFLRMLQLWPWFILTLIICFAVSWFYLNYTTPSYQAVASLMVKDDKKGSDLIDNSVLKEMGLGGSSKLVENEIEILKSYDLMDEVVNKLQLYATVTRNEKIREVPVFGNEVPFTIEVINPKAIDREINWNISRAGNDFLFKTQNKINPVTLKFGRLYWSEGINFRCMPNLLFNQDSLANEKAKDSVSSGVYTLTLKPLDKTTLEYGKKITIEPVSKQASVIDLTIEDFNEKRAAAILQSLVQIYNQRGLEDKNRVTDNTIDFLNERLKSIVKDLRGVEGAVEQFKSENKITDISTDAQQYIDASRQIDMQKAQNQTQVNIISALERELVLNQDNPQLVPSTLGIQEPSMGALIEKHNELILQKERLVQKSGPQNPLLVDLTDQIKDIRSRLLSNVRSLKQAYEISLNDISRKDEQLNSVIRNVPLLEKKLVQIRRDQNVQEQLYTFLLQKREEAALTLASNIEDSRIVANSRSIGRVSPNPTMAWAIALVCGLALPVVVVSMRDLVNYRIGDMSQVAQHTDLPVLGFVSHVRKRKPRIVINGNSRSAVAEQIRNVRTAISFTSKGQQVKTVLVTSFQPKDGKSFICLNIAASLALLNKRTVILEFDLRKPNITKLLGIDSKEGISSILTGKAEVEEVLIELPDYNGNLFLLPAGYPPPNPAELISGSKMSCLMDTLQKEFDYIIIDSPPFNLVTDASLLQRYSDITLVVLRQGHTHKQVYSELKQFLVRQYDRSTYLLLNDAGKRSRYQSDYTGSKYAREYYHEDA